MTNEYPANVSFLKVDAAQAAQAQVFRDGVWQGHEIKEPEPLTFQQYVLSGKHSSLKDKADDEVFCPVCGCCGKEQVLDDRVRIYHPSRLHPCRAPAWYQPQLREQERLVSA